MTVVDMWVGAATPQGGWVRGKVDGTTVRLAVAVEQDVTFSAPQWFVAEGPDSNGIASVSVDGLDADTEYRVAWEVDSALDTELEGRLVTLPTPGQPADFTFGMSSCAGSTSDYEVSPRVSNHPVFDTVREQAVADRWSFFLHGGDLHYRDIGSDEWGYPEGTVQQFLDAYDDVLAAPRQGHLYRQVPTLYIPDDHDGGPDNRDRTSNGRDEAMEAYRIRVPHPPLGGTEVTDAIYFSRLVGRMLLVVSDCRSDRSPQSDPDTASKTILGVQQKQWLEQVLRTSAAELLVWVPNYTWFGGGWNGYQHERAELLAMFGDYGWLDRMCCVAGDLHSLAIDDGSNNVPSNNGGGGFPVFQFAPLDATPMSTARRFSHGRRQNRGHFGTVRVQDDGGDMTVTGAGWYLP